MMQSAFEAQDRYATWLRKKLFWVGNLYDYSNDTKILKKVIHWRLSSTIAFCLFYVHSVRGFEHRSLYNLHICTSLASHWQNHWKFLTIHWIYSSSYCHVLSKPLGNPVTTKLANTQQIISNSIGNHWYTPNGKPVATHWQIRSKSLATPQEIIGTPPMVNSQQLIGKYVANHQQLHKKSLVHPAW